MLRRRMLAGLAVAVVLAVALGTGIGLGRARRSSSPSAAPAPAPETTATATASTAATAPDPAPASTTSTELPTATTAAPAGPAARYTFPVKPATGATYGRSHHDYPAADVFAPCGTTVVAPTAGRITELRATDGWSSRDDTGATRGGLSFTLLGDDGVRYYGSHLKAVDASLSVGARIDSGGEIGQVGNSGNARGTACHLHFGISPPCPRPEWRVRRGTTYPQPFLDSWRKGGSDSPSDVIARWAATNPTACAEAAALPDAARS